MRIRTQQSGFAILELVLVIIIVAAIVFAGRWVYNRDKQGGETANGTTPTSQTQSPVAHNVSMAPPVSSTSDLDKALATLNQNDPAAANSSDQGQLDSQTQF